MVMTPPLVEAVPLPVCNLISLTLFLTFVNSALDNQLNASSTTFVIMKSKLAALFRLVTAMPSTLVPTTPVSQLQSLYVQQVSPIKCTVPLGQEHESSVLQASIEKRTTTEMIEKIAVALNIDTTELFSVKNIKDYSKMKKTEEQIWLNIGQNLATYISENIKNLKKSKI